VTHRTDRTVMKHGRVWGFVHTPCRIADCSAHAHFDCDDCNRPVCAVQLALLGDDLHRCHACTAALLATLPDYRVPCKGCGQLIPAGEASTRLEIVEGLQRRLPGLWCEACL
jgi:hypothetical protein